MTKEIKCEYCDGRAEHETTTNGVCVCNNKYCLIELAYENLRQPLTDDDHKKYGEDDEEDD